MADCSPDAAGDVRIALPDQVSIFIPQGFQARIDLAASPARADDTLQLGIARLAHAQAHTIVGEDVELLDVILGLACHHRVHTTGVVADHTAQGAVIVGRGVWAEGQVILLCSVAQVVEHHAWLHTRPLFIRVDSQDMV